MSKQLQVLLVEDIPMYVSLLTHILTSNDIDLGTAGLLSEGLSLARKRTFDAVLLDLGLPDSQGFKTFSTFHAEFPEIPIVILSGMDDEKLAAMAVQQGAQDYLVKGPYLTEGEAGKDLLLRSIWYAIERQQVKAALRQERDNLETRVTERTTELKQANEQLQLELAERKRAEAALRISEANNQALIRAIPDISMRFDQQRILKELKVPSAMVNIFPSAPDIIGQSFKAIFSSNNQFFSVIEPDLSTQGNHLFESALKTNQTQIFEAEMMIAQKPYNFEYRLVIIDGGDFLMLLRDVTQSKALERMWRRYEFIANTSQELLTLVDRDYRFQAVNDAYCAVHSKPRDAIIGKTIAKIWGQEPFENQIKHSLELGLEGVENEHLGWFDFGSTGLRYFETTYYPYINSNNFISHVVVVMRDETNRKHAEDRLRRYYDRLDILRQIDRASLPARTCDEIAHIALPYFKQLVPYDLAMALLFNHQTARLMLVTDLQNSEEGSVDIQYREKEIPLVEIGVDSTFSQGIPQQVVDLRKLETPSPFELWMQRQGIRSYLLVPLIADGQMIGAINLGAYSTDIFTSENVDNTQELGRQLALMFHSALLYEQVLAGRERLQNLTDKLVSAQEDERRRISIELHDEAGQALTALKLNLVLILKALSSGSKSIHQYIQEAFGLTETTIDQIRTLAHDLRPPALDAVGLDQASSDYCQRVARQSAMIIDYQGISLPNLPSHYQISFYRVLQEALTNVIKHANASRVSVQFMQENGLLTLKVQDDGQGFLPQMDTLEGDRNGIGLVGIQERMEALGGQLRIVAPPNQGTALVVDVPWDVDDD
jgi:PAS domain S-box-containing protein